VKTPPQTKFLVKSMAEGEQGGDEIKKILKGRDKYKVYPFVFVLIGNIVTISCEEKKYLEGGGVD